MRKSNLICEGKFICRMGQAKKSQKSVLSVKQVIKLFVEIWDKMKEVKQEVLEGLKRNNTNPELNEPESLVENSDGEEEIARSKRKPIALEIRISGMSLIQVNVKPEVLYEGLKCLRCLIEMFEELRKEYMEKVFMIVSKLFGYSHTQGNFLNMKEAGRRLESRNRGIGLSMSEATLSMLMKPVGLETSMSECELDTIPARDV
jgi:hypothetical protein